MRCRTARHASLLAAEGALDQRRHVALVAHLAECAGCRDFAARDATAWARLDALVVQPPPPDALRTALDAAWSTGAAVPRPPRPSRATWGAFARAAAVTACVALGGAAGLALGGPLAAGPDRAGAVDDLALGALPADSPAGDVVGLLVLPGERRGPDAPRCGCP